MARIRTIKPEFWTDDAITECSLSARLLFIGMWNFADDRGNIERSAKQMKMKIFPADVIEVEPLIQELIIHRLVIEYAVEGRKYLHIRTFTEHQIVNRPSKNGCPEYDDSLRTHTILIEDSRTEGKGREGKGKGMDSTAAAITESVSTDSEPSAESGYAAAKESRMPVSECRKLYREYFGTIHENQPIVTVLQDICHLYPPERITEAFQAVPGAGAKSLNWVMERLKGGKDDRPKAATSAEILAAIKGAA